MKKPRPIAHRAPSPAASTDYPPWPFTVTVNGHEYVARTLSDQEIRDWGNRFHWAARGDRSRRRKAWLQRRTVSRFARALFPFPGLFRMLWHGQRDGYANFLKLPKDMQRAHIQCAFLRAGVVPPPIEP